MKKSFLFLFVIAISIFSFQNVFSMKGRPEPSAPPYPDDCPSSGYEVSYPSFNPELLQGGEPSTSEVRYPSLELELPPGCVSPAPTNNAPPRKKMTTQKYLEKRKRERRAEVASVTETVLCFHRRLNIPVDFLEKGESTLKGFIDWYKIKDKTIYGGAVPYNELERAIDQWLPHTGFSFWGGTSQYRYMSDALLEYIIKYPQLKHLEFKEVDVDNKRLVQCIQSHPNLETLKLNSWDTTGFEYHVVHGEYYCKRRTKPRRDYTLDDKLLSSILSLKNLRELELSSNWSQLMATTEWFYAFSNCMQNLERLTLENWENKRMDFVNIMSLEKLRFLLLKKFLIPDDSWNLFPKLRNLETLHIIDCPGMTMKNLCCAAVAMPYLSELKIENVESSRKDFQYLTGILAYSNSLRKLSIKSKKNLSVSQIEKLKHTLEELELHITIPSKNSSEGLGIICEIISRFYKLEKLCLRISCLDGKAPKFLKSHLEELLIPLRKLKKLELYFSNLVQPSVDFLKRLSYYKAFINPKEFRVFCHNDTKHESKPRGPIPLPNITWSERGQLEKEFANWKTSKPTTPPSPPTLRKPHRAPPPRRPAPPPPRLRRSPSRSTMPNASPPKPKPREDEDDDWVVVTPRSPSE